MPFIRDALEGNAPSIPRRRFNDETPFVGAIFPASPLTLGVTAGVGSSIASGIKNFFTGNFVGALSDATKLAVIGTEAGFGIDDPKPFIFQYYPESISDHRSNNIEFATPPGFSLPVPTLASASERIISMRLTFSQERWAGRGSKLFDARWDKYNFDVATCLQAIRMYTYPVGANFLGLGNVGVVPQPFILTLPGTLIGVNSDSIGAILKGYSIEYVSFFPDGQPRLAHVSLEMTEVLLSIGENVTGKTFAAVSARQAGGATSAIQKQPNLDGDESKGLYGISKKNDVSKTNTIPPL